MVHFVNCSYAGALSEITKENLKRARSERLSSCQTYSAAETCSTRYDLNADMQVLLHLGVLSLVRSFSN